jgi:hypothetical protein
MIYIFVADKLSILRYIAITYSLHEKKTAEIAVLE